MRSFIVYTVQNYEMSLREEVRRRGCVRRLEKSSRTVLSGELFIMNLYQLDKQSNKFTLWKY